MTSKKAGSVPTIDHFTTACHRVSRSPYFHPSLSELLSADKLGSESFLGFTKLFSSCYSEFLGPPSYGKKRTWATRRPCRRQASFLDHCRGQCPGNRCQGTSQFCLNEVEKSLSNSSSILEILFHFTSSGKKSFKDLTISNSWTDCLSQKTKHIYTSRYFCILFQHCKIKLLLFSC